MDLNNTISVVVGVMFAVMMATSMTWKELVMMMMVVITMSVMILLLIEKEEEHQVSVLQ